MTDLALLSIAVDTAIACCGIIAAMVALTASLGFLTTRFKALGWLISLLGQGLATIPSILIAMSIMVPFELSSLYWPAARARWGSLAVFVAAVVLSSISPAVLALRRQLMELEQDRGLVGRSQGWSRAKLLLKFLGHPSSARVIRSAAGSSVINLANLELLMGFIGEVGLGGGLSGAHKSWGQLLIRLRDAERYGIPESARLGAFLVCVGLALGLYALGSALAAGERRADHF